VPELFDRMEVSYKADYLSRTEWNVTHSDCTVIIARRHTPSEEPLEVLTGGTLETYRFTVNHRRPCLVLFRQDLGCVHEWLVKVAGDLRKDALLVNVAGRRESKEKGIQTSVRDFVRRLIEFERAQPE